MSLIVYVPASGYPANEQGVVNAGNGISFDIGAALSGGGGQFTVDSAVSPGLVSVLDHYPGLTRSGLTPGPVVSTDTIGPVLAHNKNAAIGDALVRGSDGLFWPSQSPGLPATYSLESDYGAPLSGSVQSALQAAVNDIITNKGGGRIQLKDRIYDFDSIVWPSVGLDQPVPVIEFVGPRPTYTVGFMPGIGLTLAQGKDMPQSSKGAILRSSQASGPAFGGLSAWSNIMPVFRNVVVRCPSNPQWQALDCGWCTNAVMDDVVADTGRSWGDGSNPLSAGAIAQPTNSGVEAIIMPGGGNGGVSVARDVLAAGFYCGLRHSEHFDGDRVTLAKCVVGLRPSDGYHAARIGRLSLYWNTYGIQPVRFNSGNPVTRLAIEEIDFEEDPVGGNWYTTVYQINDPNNYLRGRARYHRVIPAAGITFPLTRHGGAYMDLAPVSFLGGGTIDAVGFEGADSATVLPISQAEQAVTQLRGAWGISSQRAYIGTVSGSAAGDLAVWDTGATQAIFHSRVRLPATVAVTNLGLALFAVDNLNWIAAIIGNNTASIQKSDAGTYTNLSGTQTVPGTMAGSQEIDLRVSVLGKTIRMYLDGVKRASYTLSAAEWTKYSASTSHGLWAYTSGFEPGGANGGRWDFFRVERVGPMAV